MLRTERLSGPCLRADLDAIDERGVSADLVGAYLNGIGRTRLLTAAEEIAPAKRIEAGLYAEEKLPTAGADLAPALHIIVAAVDPNQPGGGAGQGELRSEVETARSIRPSRSSRSAPSA